MSLLQLLQGSEGASLGLQRIQVMQLAVLAQVLAMVLALVLAIACQCTRAHTHQQLVVRRSDVAVQMACVQMSRST